LETHIGTQRITEIINSLRSLTGLGICFYDFVNFFHYNNLGQKQNRGHYCAFCEHTRMLKNGRRLCDLSDRHEAEVMAGQYRRPFFHTCHMGITELIVPLMCEERILGIIFLGQCRLEDENASEHIRQRAQAMGGDGELYVKLYEELPLCTRDRLYDMSTVISHYFDILIRDSGAKVLQGLLPPDEALPFSERIKNYIRTNYAHSISLRSISRDLYLHPSHVSRRFHEETGLTITEFILEERIRRAKTMLRQTDISIKNIAVNVGVSDANYFTRIFKKSTGITPAVYRKTALEMLEKGIHP